MLQPVALEQRHRRVDAVSAAAQQLERDRRPRHVGDHGVERRGARGGAGHGAPAATGQQLAGPASAASGAAAPPALAARVASRTARSTALGSVSATGSSTGMNEMALPSRGRRRRRGR